MWRHRQLLWQLTKSQRSKRLQGTALGWIWDFINPIVQFLVYFLVIGKLLGLERSVENFPLYIFSGLVTVQVFISGLNATTNSFTRSRQMMRRTVFPRELLPASRMLINLVGLGPPLVILLGAAILTGWRPWALGLVQGLAGMILIFVFTYGLGLSFAVANVFIRDTVQVVGVITTLARWAVPIIYPWTLVPEQFGDGWITTLYLANPVTIGVFGMREAFWAPTVGTTLPPMPTASLVLGIAFGVIVVVLGMVVVWRYQYRVVQRLRWTT